jgi:signal transduction histidine kinase
MLVIFIASIPGYILLIPRGFIDDRFTVNPAPEVLLLNLLGAFFSIATVLLSFYLALVLFRRRPEDRMALFLSFYLLAYGVVAVGPLEFLEPMFPGTAIMIATVVFTLIMFPANYFLFVLFPDGQFVPDWTRWMALATIFTSPVVLFTFPALGWDYTDARFFVTEIIGSVWALAIMFSMFYAQIYRYRHVSNHQQKQQTKWVVFGLGTWLFLLLFTSIPWISSFTLPPGTLFPVWLAAAQVIYFLAFAIIPVSLTIAVMRERLYDIDIIINRTLVYGVLTACTMGIYVFIVGYLGNLFQAQNKSIIAFLTTGLVALIFQPLRERLQRIVDRLMYGERDDPFSVISQLGMRLETALSPATVLSDLVETVAQSLKLPYVAIVTIKNDRRQVAASFGGSKNETLKIPLIYQAERVGDLVVAQRGINEDFSPEDRSLLETIARQTGTAVRAAQLFVDLQGSRKQIITAREEERRRLRRDLHDGIGPTMASQTLKLDAALDLISGDPEMGQEQDLEEASRLLRELKGQTQETVKNIRRMVYALRPPALDDLGLIPAIQAHIAQYSVSTMGLDVSLETPSRGLPTLSAAVEVAAYSIVLEALTNVVKHAQAQTCTIKLSVSADEEGMLLLEIIDDGIGLPKEFHSGVGSTSMRERAEELGGTFVIELNSPKGTRVFAQIPVLSVEM